MNSQGAHPGLPNIAQAILFFTWYNTGLLDGVRLLPYPAVPGTGTGQEDFPTFKQVKLKL
jgi:hypothetical protein